MRRRLILAACVASTAVLASWLDLPRSSRASAPQDRVIGRLVGRNQQIEITSGANGPVYSVYRDGKLVADGVTLEQLRIKDPVAWQQVNTAAADAEPASWAGLDHE